LKRAELSRPLVVVCVAGAAAACITVNIYFPAPEVRAAAERIVEETWGAPGTTRDAVPAHPERGSRLGPLFGPRSAWAGERKPDINVSTAAIRKLKEAMRARAAKLRPYLARGVVGIGKDGMLVLRDASSLDLRERARLRRLVDAENRDRRSLYAEIARANDFGPERVDDIAEIFAETWIEKAEPGWWIQKPDGSWTRR